MAKVREMGKHKLRVGWGSEQQYESSVPVAGIAAQNEFGNPAKNIPPRPFMRPAMHKQGDNWTKTLAHGFKQVYQGRLTFPQVLNDMTGQLVIGDIKKEISEVTSPPLSPKTIKARMNARGAKKATASLTKPLIDTGVMFNSIISEYE